MKYVNTAKDMALELSASRSSNGSYMALCPAHNDHNPSLSISDGREGVVVYCHAGCSQKQVLDALRARDISIGIKNLPDFQTERVQNTYDYVDENEKLLYQVVRTAPRKNGVSKSFYQRQPKKGGWINSITNPSVRKVLYNLPTLIKGISEQKIIFIVEGEKDVETLRNKGLIATTNVGGAGKWNDEYSVYFEGADVILLPDNDIVGKKHIQQVASSIAQYVKSHHIIQLPNLPEKGDVTDWFASGKTLDDLNSIIQASKTQAKTTENKTIVRQEGYNIKPISARQLQNAKIPPINWIVDGIFAPGFTLLGGKSGIGKSWFCLHVALAVSNGAYVLGKIPVSQSSVLYLALESSKSEMQERQNIILQDMVAPENLHILTAEDEFPLLYRGGLEALDVYLSVNQQVRLVFIDSLTGLMPTTNKGNAYQAEYQALKPLYDLGIKHNACIVGLWHTTKADREDPMDMFNGTNGLAAASNGRVILKRGRYDTEAELHTMPRGASTLKLPLKWDAQLCQWSALDDEVDILQKGNARREIIQILKNSNQPMTLKEVTVAVQHNSLQNNARKQSENAIRQRVYQMEQAGDIRKVERGVYTYNNTNNSTITNNPNNANKLEFVTAGDECYIEPLTNFDASECFENDLVSNVRVVSTSKADPLDAIPERLRMTTRMMIASDLERNIELARSRCEEYGLNFEETKNILLSTH